MNLICIIALMLCENILDDGRLNFTGIANKYGLKCEEHDIVTEDGYILKVFRVPGDFKRPVLLTHGSSDTADGWIIRGEDSLAISLARLGYDVWAMNLRGTRYSRRHIQIDPDVEPSKFFNYSFYESGIYDSTATIDYILKITKEPQLTLISHSQGTTVYFIMASEKPKYNKKVKLFIALAPIVYLNNAKGFLTDALKFFTEGAVTDVKGKEIASYTRMNPYLRFFCLPTKIQKAMCRELLFTGFGPDAESLELGFLSTIIGHLPGGTTLKTLLYAVQLGKEDEFRKYDYGKKKNLEYYNSEVPPIMNLDKVTMKTALFVGKEDYLSTVPDVQRLSTKLPNVVKHLVMQRENFSHLDFIVGNKMKENLFPYIYDLLNEYN